MLSKLAAHDPRLGFRAKKGNEPPIHQRKQSQHKQNDEGTSFDASRLYGGALISEIVGNYCEIPWEDALLRRNLDLITEKTAETERPTLTGELHEN